MSWESTETDHVKIISSLDVFKAEKNENRFQLDQHSTLIKKGNLHRGSIFVFLN